MTKKLFGEYNQNRFITSVALDDTCGIEDLMKNKKYCGFREKDYHKLVKIREELNELYYEKEELKEAFDAEYKETEELNKIMHDVAELLSEEADLFSDEAIEHDINAYIELRDFDNKDAFYMAKAIKKAIKMLKGDMT